MRIPGQNGFADPRTPCFREATATFEGDAESRGLSDNSSAKDGTDRDTAVHLLQPADILLKHPAGSCSNQRVIFSEIERASQNGGNLLRRFSIMLRAGSQAGGAYAWVWARCSSG